MARTMKTARKEGGPPNFSTNSVSKPAPSASTAVTAKADIDDIFAKPSTAAASKVATDSKPEESSGDATKSGKKKKKSKSAASADAKPVEQTPASITAPGTRSKRKMKEDPSSAKDEPVTEVAVFTDPSAAASSSTKKQKITGSEKAVKSREQMVKDDEEERMFRDSRGDGPRRKTEEGFFIFKEAELNIRPESGGTAS
ncbi:hypothetical protein QFC24_005043 [Naganishia onofrii]|uniref:Uncharacterized protein n=1 Tax=Naganishia onofrii TaxID=1851511 RepID=A0ACC2XCR4_9TREE|nr:hypothetical protein QFC24_005043 [Naganishia onofrii]